MYTRRNKDNLEIMIKEKRNVAQQTKMKRKIKERNKKNDEQKNIRNSVCFIIFECVQ